jgi:SPP1 family phage portal protein
MINLVTSYMYKPGSVQYATDDDRYLEDLQEVFNYNEEPLKTEQIGRQVSIQGVGYEMFWNEALEVRKLSDGTVAPANLMPRFNKVPVSEIIPIYDYSIEPQLTHFIRFYKMDDEEIEYIDVYDKTQKVEYIRKDQDKDLTQLAAGPHGFDQVPLIVYENNEDRIGDFSCVQALIDAYDVLMSDSMNEFDRFAYAYLVMKGFTISEDDLEDLRHKRVLSLIGEKDMIEFLTKDINHEFIKFMSEWVRGEIHRQSGIPNLDDYKFGGNASGETLNKWIYLMELFTDPKESYFKKALNERVQLITSYRGLAGDPAEVEVIMNRNVPDKSMGQAEIMEKYSGHISEETLIANFADFVDDVPEEMERLKAEKESSMAMMDLDQVGGEEEEPDEDED